MNPLASVNYYSRLYIIYFNLFLFATASTNNNTRPYPAKAPKQQQTPRTLTSKSGPKTSDGKALHLEVPIKLADVLHKTPYSPVQQEISEKFDKYIKDGLKHTGAVPTNPTPSNTSRKPIPSPKSPTKLTPRVSANKFPTLDAPIKLAAAPPQTYSQNRRELGKIFDEQIKDRLKPASLTNLSNSSNSLKASQKLSNNSPPSKVSAPNSSKPLLQKPSSLFSKMSSPRSTKISPPSSRLPSDESLDVNPILTNEALEKELAIIKRKMEKKLMKDRAQRTLANDEICKRLPTRPGVYKLAGDDRIFCVGGVGLDEYNDHLVAKVKPSAKIIRNHGNFNNEYIIGYTVYAEVASKSSKKSKKVKPPKSDSEDSYTDSNDTLETRDAQRSELRPDPDSLLPQPVYKFQLLNDSSNRVMPPGLSQPQKLFHGSSFHFLYKRIFQGYYPYGAPFSPNKVAICPILSSNHNENDLMTPPQCHEYSTDSDVCAWKVPSPLLAPTGDYQLQIEYIDETKNKKITHHLPIQICSIEIEGPGTPFLLEDNAQLPLILKNSSTFGYNIVHLRLLRWEARGIHNHPLYPNDSIVFEYASSTIRDFKASSVIELKDFRLEYKNFVHRDRNIKLYDRDLFYVVAFTTFIDHEFKYGGTLQNPRFHVILGHSEPFYIFRRCINIAAPKEFSFKSPTPNAVVDFSQPIAFKPLRYANEYKAFSNIAITKIQNIRVPFAIDNESHQGEFVPPIKDLPIHGASPMHVDYLDTNGRIRTICSQVNITSTQVLLPNRTSQYVLGQAISFIIKFNDPRAMPFRIQNPILELAVPDCIYCPASTKRPGFQTKKYKAAYEATSDRIYLPFISTFAPPIEQVLMDEAHREQGGLIGFKIILPSAGLPIELLGQRCFIFRLYGDIYERISSGQSSKLSRYELLNERSIIAQSEPFSISDIEVEGNLIKPQLFNLAVDYELSGRIFKNFHQGPRIVEATTNDSKKLEGEQLYEELNFVHPDAIDFSDFVENGMMCIYPNQRYFSTDSTGGTKVKKYVGNLRPQWPARISITPEYRKLKVSIDSLTPRDILHAIGIKEMEKAIEAQKLRPIIPSPRGHPSKSFNTPCARPRISESIQKQSDATKNKGTENSEFALQSDESFSLEEYSTASGGESEERSLSDSETYAPRTGVQDLNYSSMSSKSSNSSPSAIDSNPESITHCTSTNSYDHEQNSLEFESLEDYTVDEHTYLSSKREADQARSRDSEPKSVNESNSVHSGKKPASSKRPVETNVNSQASRYSGKRVDNARTLTPKQPVLASHNTETISVVQSVRKTSSVENHVPQNLKVAKFNN